MFTKTQKIIIAVAGLLAVISLFLAYNSVSSDALEIHFLDVGQGDGMLIRTPNGNNILVDAGRNDAILEHLSRKLPFYEREIDLIIPTNMSADHIGGFNYVLEEFDVQGVLTARIGTDTQTSESFWQNVEEQDISVMRAKKGDKMLIDEDIKMKIKSPDTQLLESASNNDQSLVVRITYKEDSFLLTGDAERRAENIMASDDSIVLDSDVLKVGHHGSRTSTTEYFIDRVDPQIAVIQLGKNNQYGHPHDEVLQNLEGVEVYRNDLHGTVSIYSYGDSF